MSDPCCNETPVFDGVSAAYRRVLWVVISINATMFAVETGAGFLAQSQALQADALDFLGDTLTYGVSLMVIGRTVRWRASAALFKALSLAAFGLWVLGATIYRSLVLGMPEPMTMGAIAVLALAANVFSAVLLYRFRDGDANVRSVWLCSRNDAIGNVAVMGAAGAVAVLHSPWPDLIVAAGMAGLFLQGAWAIMKQAREELAQASDVPQAAGD